MLSSLLCQEKDETVRIMPLPSRLALHFEVPTCVVLVARSTSTAKQVHADAVFHQRLLFVFITSGSRGRNMGVHGLGGHPGKTQGR